MDGYKTDLEVGQHVGENAGGSPPPSDRQRERSAWLDHQLNRNLRDNRRPKRERDQLKEVPLIPKVMVGEKGRTISVGRERGTRESD